MTPLYLFGTPGNIGGAATKIKHLIELLRNDFQITVVVNNPVWLKDSEVKQISSANQIPVTLLKRLPKKLDGIALSICEPNIFTSGVAREIKRRGLRFLFSNEMMWAFKGEQQAVTDGLIDKVLFASEFQASEFKDLHRNTPQAITGNYVSPNEFPFQERNPHTLTIGRLSRPDPEKYPEDFPVFYEELNLPNSRFRVMAWSRDLAKKYRWHKFDQRWDLLEPGKESPPRFLRSIDLFIYPLGHTVKESWGRSTVEAMLTGCIPLTPTGHQFHNLMEHEKSGFICNRFEDFHFYANELNRNPNLKHQISLEAARHARDTLCNAQLHRQTWKEALLN